MVAAGKKPSHPPEDVEEESRYFHRDRGSKRGRASPLARRVFNKDGLGRAYLDKTKRYIDLIFKIKSGVGVFQIEEKRLESLDHPKKKKKKQG